VTVKTERDKLMSLSEAARLVRDRDIVALGGGLSHREPMALVRELVRQQRRELRLVGSAHGVDVDLLTGAGCVGVVEESYVGYEQDLGLAPAFRRAIESGAVELRETCCYTLLQQLRAAEYGLPFMPVRGVLGSGIMGLHPEFRELTCPFTGERLLAVPALAPDVALIHVPTADRRGNVELPKPYVLDEHFANASRTVIVSAERVVPEGELGRERTTLPYHLVSAVVEAPLGAHPTSCYPDYSYDREQLRRWVEAAGSDEQVAAYVRDVVGESEERYREAIASDVERLASWQESPAAWMELMA
jgi:glutaconate CoA-transferase, subunit A